MVQVPLAKPSIMLGVNQTIMMALGIVVIAAFVGAGGLGQTVLDGLQGGVEGVGEALNGGIAIVIMAIILDRVTNAWSLRDRRHVKPVRIAGRTLSHRQLAVGAIIITILAVVIGREVLREQSFPDDRVISVETSTGGEAIGVAAPADAIVRWSQEHLSDLASAVSDFVLIRLLDPLETLLVGVPWWMVAGAFALVGWRVSGWRLAIGSFACITRPRPAGHVGPLDGNAGPGVRRGRHHHGRSRSRSASSRRRTTGSSALATRCSTRCRRCRRSCIWCRSCS